jgi:hypothetical protein
VVPMPIKDIRVGAIRQKGEFQFCIGSVGVSFLLRKTLTLQNREPCKIGMHSSDVAVRPLNYSRSHIRWGGGESGSSPRIDILAIVCVLSFLARAICCIGEMPRLGRLADSPRSARQ